VILMMVIILLVASVAFGAGDQFLGSSSWATWAAGTSLLVAPWLLLPFAAACSQLRPRRGALIGLVVTTTAVLAYDVMTYSPTEGVHMGFLRAALSVLRLFAGPYTVAGLVTGLLFGWLGQLWRSRRAWAAAILAAGAACLESVAGLVNLNSRNQAPAAVWVVELGIGLALAAYFVASGMAYRRAAHSGAADASDAHSMVKRRTQSPG
jgi:hypothetical protein